MKRASEAPGKVLPIQARHLFKSNLNQKWKWVFCSFGGVRWEVSLLGLCSIDSPITKTVAIHFSRGQYKVVGLANSFKIFVKKHYAHFFEKNATARTFSFLPAQKRCANVFCCEWMRGRQHSRDSVWGCETLKTHGEGLSSIDLPAEVPPPAFPSQLPPGNHNFLLCVQTNRIVSEPPMPPLHSPPSA